jgi:predicted restriction endonuclease
MGQKPSWKDHQLIDAIPKCNSFTEVANYLNMSKSTNSLLKKRSNELGLDYSHFKTSGINPKSLEEILVYSDGKISSTHRLKLRLINENYFEHKCYVCGITEWNGKPVPIELEHINGNRYDNRLQNLTIVCPNCHAQTETYRGKNIKKKKKD